MLIRGVNLLPTNHHRNWWRFFALAVMGLALILLFLPLATLFNYHWVKAGRPAAASQTATMKTDPVMPANSLAAKTQPVKVATATVPSQPVKKSANQIVIPKIGVAMKIAESKDGKVLWQGVAWRLPGTSTPDLGGNTVIAAHRYLFRPPSSRTFYLLDKLAAGDLVKIFWNGQEYQYQVREIKVVTPKQVEILENTKEPILTLFTCTPLFTSKNRLVVVAELVR